ncbi:hypothetical protein IWZ01DRAFT_485528 [Phyllosticta capitalensis]
MASFHFGTGQSSFFTINRGRIHFPNDYRNQRRVDEHFRFQDPRIDRDAIAVRDTSLPLSMRLAAWDRWKAADAKVMSDWVAAGRPPCTWCLQVHPPPHVSREDVERRHETRFVGRNLEGGKGPCQRCACRHGRHCNAPQCHFCGNYHWESVPCERAARRRAAAGLAAVRNPVQEVERQDLEAEEQRRVETVSFEAMRNTIRAMESTPLEFATMAQYWKSFLHKADIDPYDLRYVMVGAMKALIEGTALAKTAAVAMYLAPLLSELSQKHSSRFQGVLSEMLDAFIRGAVVSIRDLSNVARLADAVSSYLAQNTAAQNTTAKRRVDDEYDGYGASKRMKPAYSQDDIIWED